MADKYSTIQQHQPLRVPPAWGRDERALIVQLDEIFDDLYRRFGRLRIEDMGKALVKEIKDKYGRVNGIYMDENGIDILSTAGENKHIVLKSDESEVNIRPDEILMNTPGKLKLIGKGDSFVEFQDETSGQVFRVDTSGVQAQTFKGDMVDAETVEAKTITAEEIICPNSIPNIVHSTIQPEAGNNTIWLEPTTTSGGGGAYTETRTIGAAAGSSCKERDKPTFTYSVSLNKPIDLTDVTYVQLQSRMNRKGNDYGFAFTVTAKIRCSDGTMVNIGQVGDGRSRGTYSMNGSRAISGIAKSAVGVVYTLTVQDQFAYLSQFYSGTLTLTGNNGSTITSDVVTVHYIP